MLSLQKKGGMKMKVELNQIGVVKSDTEGLYIEVEKSLLPALRELDTFSHMNVLCWFDKSDSEEARTMLEVPSPYKNSPEIMGIFATRSPIRPNPIALSTVQILSIDHQSGRIGIAYIDADEGTPVIDLKPYTPSLDRVETPIVPLWCKHWPNSIEESGTFDWEGVFNF
jgi:tRNA-Thr(GGU) m(6)t(6)A37 methyltransferase TsaA